jgi:GLPGLI family protein
MIKHLLFILVTCLSIHAQELASIECKYKIIVKEYSPEELNAIKDPNVKSRLIIKQKQNANREFLLKGNLKNAIFGEVQKMKGDNVAGPSFSDTEKYYFDIDKSIVYNSLTLFGTKYLVAHEFSVYNWIISGETKMIDGYKCFNATGVQKIDDIRGKKEYNLTAWFCPELPFKYGPHYYFGLPGLIFEAGIDNLKEKYVLISIKLLNENIAIEKPKGMAKTEKEFRQVFNEAIKNYSGR